MCGFIQRFLLFLFTFVFLQTSFNEIVFAESDQPKNLEDPNIEIWELSLTGAVIGKSDMVFRRLKTEEDTFFVSGKFSGKYKDWDGQAGTAVMEIKGRTKKSVFSAMAEGQAHIITGMGSGLTPFFKGKLIGAFAKSEGFGTYKIRGQDTALWGKWTAKKIK